MNKQKEHNLKLQFEYELEEFIKEFEKENKIYIDMSFDIFQDLRIKEVK